MFSILLWFTTTIGKPWLTCNHNYIHNQCQCLNFLIGCSEYSRCKWKTIAGTSQPQPILWASRESGKNTRSWPKTPLSGFISPSLNGTTWTGDIFGLNPHNQQTWTREERPCEEDPEGKYDFMACIKNSQVEQRPLSLVWTLSGSVIFFSIDCTNRYKNKRFPGRKLSQAKEIGCRPGWEDWSDKSWPLCTKV